MRRGKFFVHVLRNVDRNEVKGNTHASRCICKVKSSGDV